jgi:hypothetical protein
MVSQLLICILCVVWQVWLADEYAIQLMLVAAIYNCAHLHTLRPCNHTIYTFCCMVPQHLICILCVVWQVWLADKYAIQLMLVAALYNCAHLHTLRPCNHTIYTFCCMVPQLLICILCVVWQVWLADKYAIQLMLVAALYNCAHLHTLRPYNHTIYTFCCMVPQVLICILLLFGRSG